MNSNRQIYLLYICQCFGCHLYLTLFIQEVKVNLWHFTWRCFLHIVSMSAANPEALIFQMYQTRVTAQRIADLMNRSGPPGCRQVLCWSKPAHTPWTFVLAYISFLLFIYPPPNLQTPLTDFLSRRLSEGKRRPSMSCQKATTLLSSQRQTRGGESEPEWKQECVCAGAKTITKGRWGNKSRAKRVKIRKVKERVFWRAACC